MRRSLVRFVTRGVSLVLLALPAALLPAAAWGQGVLSVEVVNGHNLVVDSNVTSPATYAPRSAYIGARFCNAGNAPLENVIAYAGDYNAGAGDTPGIFPATTFGIDPQHPHLSGSGSYSLTIEADATGAADGTRYLGTLAAGACRMEYWLFSYPQCVNVDPDGAGPAAPAADYPPCEKSIAGEIKPDDDVALDYDVWATTSSAIAQPTVSATRSFTLRNEISAAANKIWPNTTSKVPDAYLAAIESVLGWGTIGPDGQPLTPASSVYPGQRVITTQGIWYDLGNVGQGFDNNGDLVPDQNAWLQPVGDPASFDADCFRMVNVYGVVIVKLKTGSELLIPFQNRLYFENIPENTGVVGLVYYQYLATDAGCSANLTPYQEAASGFDNEKFSADYGLALGLASRGYGSALTFTKSDGVSSVAPGGTLTYTLTAANTGTGANLGAPDLGVPLVFRETIPAGATYVEGSAAAGLVAPSGDGTYSQGYTDADGNYDSCTINYSFSSPASYVILYSTDGGASWGLTDPGTAVTDLQWLLLSTLLLDGGHDGTDCVLPDGAHDNGTLETSLPAGTTASLTFRVTVNTAAPHPGPVLCDTAGIGFGPAAPGVTARDCDLVTGGNTLSGVVFRDTGGTGGIFGNGVQDNATETGIGAGVVVRLFYDANGDGAHDAGDLLYGSTATAANGTYSFTNLPDGPFLAVVRKYDGPAADGVNNAATDAAFGTAGWGDTTYDPNLPLTTGQGVLKLGEDLTSATLAVNIDLARGNAAPQTVANANFGFAPPLRLAKKIMSNPDANGDFVADTPIDEGRLFSYAITLENRLPSVGRQGPTGCEYTFWATDGVTGGNANTQFTNAPSAWDATAPNGSVASAFITGNPNRIAYGRFFRIAPQGGLITKVEALTFGYFSAPLNNDILNLAVRLGGSSSTTTLNSAMIDNYVGPRPDLDPNSAISWDVTASRPGGGAWGWTDFYNSQFEINPSKTAGSDQQWFYLDAIGYRVTTDTACEGNASTTLSPVPLQDRFDVGRIAFVSADPAPDSVNPVTGVIQWSDVGPIPAGSTRTVTVRARSLNVSGTATGSCAAFAPPGAEPAAQPPAWSNNCNYAQTAFPSHNVRYADGRGANDDYGKIAATFQGQGEIRGTVWNDTNCSGGATGWPKGACEPGLPDVTVTLYACTRPDGTLEPATNKTCSFLGDSWRVVATAVTGAGGAYEFIGLRAGVYIVEVGDTDGAPAAGNAAPYGGTQTAEGLDSQAATLVSGNTWNANGATCAAACNNTWGNPAANLDAMNQINLPTAEEIVNGVNFGYNAITASLYGRVWHDIDGDALYPPEAGETGLAGFAVEVRAWTDGNANGSIDAGEVGAAVLAAATTDASGDYTFSGLSATGYAVLVRPPTLLSKVWTETHETTGGTAALDGMIPVTLASGQVSGSHDFGYTAQDASDIGDTLWYDFNGNGVREATEAGIPGVTVRLYQDVDRDGTVDAGADALLRTTVTDSAGRYLFTDLPAGGYVVEVDTADPDFPGGVTATGDPDLPAGRIGGRIFFDADESAGFNAGDEGIANVVVVLYEDTNGSGALEVGTDGLVAATLADVNGVYLFGGLNAGRYFVDVADDAGDPNGNTLPSASLAPVGADPRTSLVVLAGPASAVLGVNAGYSPGSGYLLGNRVWSDADGDGVQDAGEMGISGVRVRVWTAVGGDACFSGDGGATGGCTVTTDVAGFWLRAGLAAGRTYTATVIAASLPRGFQPTSPAGAPSGSRTILMPAADSLDADFGYRYDCQPSGSSCSPDGVADRDPGDPAGSVSGRIFLDGNGNGTYDAGEGRSGTTVNLLDETGSVVASTGTAADGTYSFTTAAASGIFVGTYSVQAVDPLGTRESVVFVAAGQAITDLDLAYDSLVETVADSRSGVSVDGVHDDLRQDFGYRRFAGSIGDTVYQDANGNATQDPGEPGIAGVAVHLFLCSWSDDGDGLFESGEETGCPAAMAETVTASDDPATPAAEGGTYLFSNLDVPAAGQYYVVRVVTSTLPGVPTLTGDPDTDGAPCTMLPDPDDPDDEFPPLTVCDSLHLVPAFVEGTNYLGADFAYRLAGAGFGTIGDHLWIDADGDGTIDAGEAGIPFVTVWNDGNADGVLTWTDANGNDVWDSGEGERWVETDSDGYYVFTGLSDGTHLIRVHVGDPDWPVGLPTTPVYKVRPDNTAGLDNTVVVAVGDGAATLLIDGDPATADACTRIAPEVCNLDADFGYRYPGAQTLAGTICTESGTLNGFCGDTANTYAGVGTGESPLAGIVVNLYLWTDGPAAGEAWDGATGALDADDAFTLLGSASTGANGDYAFANVPTGKLVLAFGVPDTQNLRLTTTNANSSLAGGTSLQLHEGTALFQSRTVTVLARQAIMIAGDAAGVDFAFDPSLGGAITYDFGDLPDTAPDFGATLLADGGARHLVPASPTIHLGAGISTEADGKPSADAGLHPDLSGDILDDGVVLEQFAESSDDGGVHYPGGSLYVTASAAGWLAGWIDFNQDGDFADEGEMILDLAVSAGTSRLSFDVPISLASVSPDFYARFRIYPSRPLMTSSTGPAFDAAFGTVGGEVEDYFWNLAVTPAIVTSFSACDAGGAVALEWRTASGAASLGFLLRRWDEGRRDFVDAGGRLLPALIGSARGGVYRFLDAAATPERQQQYELIEIEAMGRRTRHGPFDVDAAIPCDGETPTGYAREAAPKAPPAAAPFPAAAADGPVDLPETGPFAKIATSEEAMHYLDAAALARVLGISPEEARRNLRRNRYALTSGGQPVAFHPAGGHAGVWYFAQRQRSQFARENVYRMGPGDAGGLRMQVRDEDASGRRAGERTFPRVVREERDLLPGHAIFTDARRDHWLWDFLDAGEPPKSFAVRSDAVARDGGEAVLTLLFIGATDTEADPDHHALVRLNGTPIGEVLWNGLATREAAFTFDAALLADGENVVEIAALDDTGAPYSIFYLDSITLAYRSRYRATGDRLAFEAAGNRVLRITGFSTPDILLFDVTRPRRPVRVTAKAFADGEGGWGVSIAPRSPNGRYQALTRQAAALPARIVADRPSRLRDRASRGRYLVVTTRELLGPARRLAAYRGGIVVDIEDIYDEFNHGVPSPFALRSFLDHAWHRWRVRPRHVLLAGDGTYDYRDNLGLGGNLIPPMMVGTAEGLFPSDAWFADVAGGPAPEMAIGRLPAASAAELDVLVDKILLRESAADRDWVGRLLAVADDADDAGDFPGESDRLTELVPPDVAVTRIHLGALPLAAARKALLGGINSGAGLVNYLGHAGFEILADEGLLRSGDVPLLANTGRPTVMTAMTCLAGDFSLPGAPGLAELLVRSGSGGAAAVWAPSGLSVNEPALRLAEGFYAAAFTGGDDVRIGDAVLAAQRAYERGHHAPQLLRLYVLLGDPAMRLR